MPSSHAQSINFFTFFATAALLDAIRISSLNPDATIKTPSIFLNHPWVTLAVMHCTTAAMLWVRVLEDYHTPAQILVGTIIGSSFGYGWYYLAHYYINHHFEGMLEL